jgi:hypothetical protein
MFLSSMLIVVFSTERVFAVWMPLKMATVFTVRRRYKAIAALIFTGGLMKVHILIHFKANQRDGYGTCWYELEMDQNLKMPLAIYDIGSSQIIPCFLIFTLNILIGLGIRYSRRKIKLGTDEELRRYKRDLRCIVNLLVVSTVYFIFTTPRSVLWLYTDLITFVVSKYDPSITQQYMNKMYEISVFGDMLNMFNYSLNFLIYGVSLNYYRQTIKAIIMCRRVTKHEVNL